MTDKEMKQYVGQLIQKYDYYDPMKDRLEALRFGNVKNKKILDIGTGKGYLAILAAKNFGCDVTSIDISKEKMRIARENAKAENVLEKIFFRISNASHISYANNSFDVVISFNALHHSKKIHKKIIKEMFRVSQDKVVIIELNEMGAKVFDDYIHPEENHKAMIIDLKNLEKELCKYSEVKRYDRKLMSTFVCKKSKGGIR
jgi:ubiquinone/menaquinone biosynthesis C-methylase UbiE